MCKCTPNLRTPFCGKPGCEYSEQKAVPLFPRGKIMDTKRMRACSPLLPPPGEEVVCECLDEIDRLNDAMRMAASILERDGDEHSVGYALRRAMTANA